MRFGYADPPYPGLAKRYYGQPEVDHVALVAALASGVYDGWALSTSSRSLGDVLSLIPGQWRKQIRVLAWVKPIGGSDRCLGLHSCWEPVIIVPGRRRRPGQRDWLRAFPARGGGDLMGRKPLAFCTWLFACLGMQPGDELDDLFPGTGIVGRTWRELSCESAGDVSLLQQNDASAPGAGDVAGRSRRR
jgi:hypothetical protein